MTNSNITPFSFESTEVRVIERDGQPWFVLSDVCSVLEHSNPSMAASRLDDDEKGVSNVYTPGGSQEFTIINESGLYSLILTSRKPEAKRFKRWVTGEVLPALRKTGGYQIGSESSDQGLIAPRVAREWLETAKAFGFSGNQALLSADRATKAITGISPLEIMGHTHLPAPVQQMTYTPTEIGKMLEPPKSGAGVNTALRVMGLQVREGNRWVPTKAAKGLCEILDTGRKHSNGVPVKQVKWYAGIKELLQIEAEDAA